jgi:leucyl-tRNA synthetase
MNDTYDHSNVEEKWMKYWKEKEVYKVDIQNAKNPFYNLWMFPYPSGARMHVGHAYASTGSDIIGRYMRMKGHEVFQPMGFDAFGIHGENYAIKIGEHPQGLMEDLCNKFRDEQFYPIGHGYDWSKEIRTYWPDYYKWTQWIFMQLFNHGLAYRDKALVNWCPGCKTVLADEQVINGECERCHNEVEKKELEQWFFRITKYAEKLLKNLEHIDWSPKVKEAQKNWIGKKEGINITYPIENSEFSVTCFTTRPDTNFGATFIVLAPEHSLVKEILNNKTVDEYVDPFKAQIQVYVESAQKKSELERISEGRKKTGVFTGLFAINPLTQSKMPVWISDFVLPGVGTGAVVGVPGHDKRDFEFATEFGIEVIRVVVGNDNDVSPISNIDQVQEDSGHMINSGFLNGMEIHEAKEKIMDYIEQQGWGKKAIVYKLRDWLISRQRYWSAPIPIIYCDKCGIVPVPEADLPVLLPYTEDWKPKGDGRGPLANISEFVNTKCPKCGGKAQRETDTIDNFLDSAWYFFRYPYANRLDVPFSAPGIDLADKGLPDSRSFSKWLPVHLYIGGAEHSVLHLMYTRFITMAFNDMGFFDFEEPFKRFYAHGLIIKDGKKMSKSLGNVVNPDEYINKYGADVFRMYMLFIGPFDQGGDFSDKGISGITRYLNRIYKLSINTIKAENKNSSEELLKNLHKTIKTVGEETENIRFNTTIAKLMEFLNKWETDPVGLSLTDLIKYIKLLAPYAPFITEELYQLIKECNDRNNNNLNLGDKGFKSIHLELWPEYDEKLIFEETVTIVIQINGKYKAALNNMPKGITKDDVTRLALTHINKNINEKEIKNIIYVQDKILNLVI